MTVCIADAEPPLPPKPLIIGGYEHTETCAPAWLQFECDGAGGWLTPVPFYIDPDTGEPTETTMIEIQGNPGGSSAAKPLTLDCPLPTIVGPAAGIASELIADAIALGKTYDGTTLAPVAGDVQAITGQADPGVIYGGQVTPASGGNIRDINGVSGATAYEVPEGCEWTPVVCFCTNLTDKELAAVAVPTK